MREILAIYFPAALIAMFISGFLGRFLAYKKLLYLGVYCMVVPVFAGFSYPEIGRWSVVLPNSAGLLFVVLALWLAERKRGVAERQSTGEAIAEQGAARQRVRSGRLT